MCPPDDGRARPPTAEVLHCLAERVRHRLSGRLRDLRIEVTDAGLVLRGRAITYHASLLALDVVKNATDLVAVQNEIEVT